MSSEGSDFFDLPQPDAMSEEDFLAAGVQQFGSDTLPHSTTTKAEALAMMMSLLSANGFSWKALDDLWKMSNTFFCSCDRRVSPKQILVQKDVRLEN